VLLAQRNPGARFMGGAWVFPGGAVNPGDGDGDDGRRAAALRELAEEVGVTLPDPAALVAFSRWITPAVVKIRYDTWFFLAAAPPGTEPAVDAAEVVDARWFTPANALSASRNGEILLVFPTIKHLEQISAFASADQLMAHARDRTVVPVQPRVLGTGETARIVLPGEPGYAD
jgi:8-oxo-dGTP pyrophosphatase MutT (NUDIX family)